MDYRAMFDRDYVGAWELEGKDVTVTICKVEAKTLTAQGNRKNRKPVIWFHGKEKGLALNKTNGKVIAAMYGNDTSQWIDKSITIYPTQTEMSGETVDCIRIRPRIPQPPSQSQSRKTESQGAAS